MHRVPAARRHLRTIEPERVCAAAGTIADLDRVRRWADLLTVLGDANRLALLLCLHGTGELCVSDLAVATGMSDSGVSHALRLLRAHGLVEVQRSGRLAHYRLADQTTHELLHLLTGTPADALHEHEAACSH